MHVFKCGNAQCHGCRGCFREVALALHPLAVFDTIRLDDLDEPQEAEEGEEPDGQQCKCCRPPPFEGSENSHLRVFQARGECLAFCPDEAERRRHGNPACPRWSPRPRSPANRGHVASYCTAILRSNKWPCGPAICGTEPASAKGHWTPGAADAVLVEPSWTRPPLRRRPRSGKSGEQLGRTGLTAWRDRCDRQLTEKCPSHNKEWCLGNCTSSGRKIAGPHGGFESRFWG